MNIIIIQDNSGDIENEELSGFLKDLLELVKTVKALEILLNISIFSFNTSITLDHY